MPDCFQIFGAKVAVALLARREGLWARRDISIVRYSLIAC